MCTVVCRWSPDHEFPVQMLALRDELVSRAYDLPGAWWPEQPGVVGGRDRTAGGSWCVCDVESGVTSVVLNQPDKPIADPGAPSRGVLPLTAAAHRERWVEHLDVTGMAGFNLVLATPKALTWWRFDGAKLTEAPLAPATYMFTPGGLREAVDRRFTGESGAETFGDSLAGLVVTTEQAWGPWLAVVRESVPTSDPGGLLVRRPVDGDSFETVFGQFIAARPGTLRLDYTTTPSSTGRWTTGWWSR